MFVSKYIVIVVMLALLDGLWISSNIGMYRGMYSKIQGSAMNVNILGAILAYVFVFVMVAFVVVPFIEKTTKGTFWDCVKIGGLVGLCTYAIYNFTNMATFKDYSVKVALMDTIWGGVLFTLMAYVTVIVTR